MYNPALTKKPLSDLELTPIAIDEINIKKAARLFEVITHDLRKQIIKMSRDNKDITVTELYTKLKLARRLR